MLLRPVGCSMPAATQGLTAAVAHQNPTLEAAHVLSILRGSLTSTTPHFISHCRANSTNDAHALPCCMGTYRRLVAFSRSVGSHQWLISGCAGKSASLIMRKIQPGALQAARQHHLDQAVAWMQALSLSDVDAEAAAAAGPSAAQCSPQYACCA